MTGGPRRRVPDPAVVLDGTAPLGLRNAEPSAAPAMEPTAHCSPLTGSGRL